MKQTAIILVSESSLPLAMTVARSVAERAVVYTKNEVSGCTAIGPYAPFLKAHWEEFEAVVFIGALGICVRRSRAR